MAVKTFQETPWLALARLIPSSLACFPPGSKEFLTPCLQLAPLPLCYDGFWKPNLRVKSLRG
ncbi:rCG60682, isoform CRA_c [Rattus norvegicus]|uniref:RCG60682, isoform CRA_c n=1 Tax=Rattus norvegicus TaxID=10116 RepID=A6JJY5_RAT|nr:rCG60682, isoform CRA_c [Rattus norvegicus]